MGRNIPDSLPIASYLEEYRGTTAEVTAISRLEEALQQVTKRVIALEAEVAQLRQTK